MFRVQCIRSQRGTTFPARLILSETPPAGVRRLTDHPLGHAPATLFPQNSSGGTPKGAWGDGGVMMRLCVQRRQVMVRIIAKHNLG